ncbi:hypothetical protein V502_08389 [Pseudogymnoascus sp. VKM F-4520 (FW-2644)]|nr:hypothetical protein V502_08389 [Pseudogymnoascus sp. VKM F-4520 (FW-2644)]
MDEYTNGAFANRDGRVPVIRLDSPSSQSEASNDLPGNENKGKGHSIRSKLGDKARKMVGRAADNKGDNGDKAGKGDKGPSMQDRLLEKLLQQVIPVEDQPRNQEGSPYSNRIERPAFSLPTMSTNFRRFNSRIGVVFVFQARVIRLLSWQKYSHTISLLAVYTFVCLDPHLITVLPLAGLLLGVFIPSFIARHPAPPVTLSTSFEYSPRGPPIAPAPTVKPVKELSKDFFRNMGDLQNCMEDFSQVHDQVLTKLAPPMNFSNEPLSSALFLFLFMSTAAMFIASHLVPWRFCFLIGGWCVIFSGHPAVAKKLASTHDQHVAPRESEAKSWLDTWVAKDIMLDMEPETREVEVFELQKLDSRGEWEPWLYSASPYDPLAAPRIANERPRGTPFFEDVAPPRDWEWSEKKWNLDLWSREWVEERIITGVEVETEGERWVYDIHYENSNPEPGLREATGKVSQKPKPTWEEGVEGEGKKGQWRRRSADGIRLAQQLRVLQPLQPIAYPGLTIPRALLVVDRGLAQRIPDRHIVHRGAHRHDEDDALKVLSLLRMRLVPALLELKEASRTAHMAQEVAPVGELDPERRVPHRVRVDRVAAVHDNVQRLADGVEGGVAGGRCEAEMVVAILLVRRAHAVVLMVSDLGLATVLASSISFGSRQNEESVHGVAIRSSVGARAES